MFVEQRKRGSCTRLREYIEPRLWLIDPRVNLMNISGTHAARGACAPQLSAHTGSVRWPIIEQRATFSRPIIRRRLARVSGRRNWSSSGRGIGTAEERERVINFALIDCSLEVSRRKGGVLK